MKVVTFLNSKGGVGKTTLCANIARALTLHDKRVQLVDADDQLKFWHNAGDGLGMELVAADTRASLSSAFRLSQQVRSDYMFIDTPGKLLPICGAALSMTDLAIIPIQPSPLDVWSTMLILDLIRSAREVNPRLKAIIVINQALKSSLLTKDVLESIKDEAPDFDLAETIIYARVEYARQVNNGNTSLESSNKAAHLEIYKLTDEILEKLNGI